MRQQHFASILLRTACALVTLAAAALADTGPKPTMTFRFVLEGKHLEIAGGRLLQCEDSACRREVALRDVGPQHFSCGAVSCAARAYGFSHFARIEVTFSDHRTRRSNIFADESFDARYKVVVKGSTLIITAEK